MTEKLSELRLLKWIRSQKEETAISVNWRRVIPVSFLRLFEKGILNFHLGNLPDYKGNATPNWAILQGEKFIAANVHQMTEQLDSGDILACSRIAIRCDTYVGDILKEAQALAPRLFEEALKKIRGTRRPGIRKNHSLGLRCYPRLEEDSEIRWSQTAEEICRLVRASSKPYSGAFTFLNGKKVKIWKAKVVRPKHKFLAVPGHVVEVDRQAGSVRVACRDHFLELEEIGIGGSAFPPARHIKSIRMRFKSREARA
ncbi:formyltransferase family protein [Omnitrophica bacterium]|nr:formyltransferase family protein [Candidatus Omnitrophota bacterium]